MADSAETGLQLSKLHKLITRNRYDDIEILWPDALESKALSSQDLVQLAGLVARRGEVGRAEALAVLVMAKAEEQAGGKAALSSGRHAVQQRVAGDDLEKEIVRLYSEVYAEREELPALMERIRTDDPPLADFVAKMDMYLDLAPGTFVQGQVSLEPGEVVSIDGTRAVVAVSFDKRHYDFGIDKVHELRPLPADHFPAMVLYRPESLRDQATESPIDFIMLALRSAKDNRITYRELKQRVGHLLGESGWTAWWKHAKPLCRRAPLIDMSSGSQPAFRLLTEEKRYEDQLQQRFRYVKDPVDKLKIAIAYLNETEGNKDFEPDTELLVEFGNGAARIAMDAFATDPPLALLGLAVHDEVAARGVSVATPNPKAAVAVVAKLDEPKQLTQRLPEAYVHNILDYLKRVWPEWPGFWLDMLQGAGKRLCDKIARAMIEEQREDDVAEVITGIVSRPTTSPEVVCWFWRARLSSTIAQKLSEREGLSGTDVLHGLVVLADSVGRLLAVSGEERYRKTLESVQNALMLKNGEPAREVLAEIDHDIAGDFKTLIAANNGLTGRMRGMLLGVLRGRFEDLFVEESRPWEDDAIYTTETGLRNREQDLAGIIRDDIPEVAKQIGEAAAFGDLSENAEYTAALEKRDQLTSRATRIESELKIAEVISAEMIESDYVNIGTQVTTRNKVSGEEEVYTFLGPWDSQPEKGILTYNAPLSLAFMGLRVGEEVVYGEDGDEQRWEILKIEPGI